jgi:hypothetical protein
MTETPSGRRRGKATSASAAADRSLEGRLARVHLRGGMLAMARAELEALVAGGGLDTPALADLAEARWRSGDLTGAGAAAAAHLDEGGQEPMAMVVAAEALAVRGRTAEARAQSARALAVIGGNSPEEARAALEALFAGQPRAAFWPDARSGVALETALDGDETADPPLGSARLRRTPETEALSSSADEVMPDANGAEAPAGNATAARPSARDEVEIVEAAIDARRVRDVAVRLTIMLREEGARAPLVLSLAERALEVAATPPVAAGLHLVAGDAYRSMGRDTEAAGAYERARQALGGAASSEGDR